MKVEIIKKVGCIEEMTIPIDLSSNAFIYGLNGSGKSTIKNILKGGFTEGSKLEPSFSGTPKMCEAKLSIFNETIIYESAKLQSPFTKKIKLFCFDEEFIENNIYINGSISDDHKKQYFRMFVGENVGQKIDHLLNKHLEMLSENTQLKSKLDVMSNNYNSLDYFYENLDESIKILNTSYDQNFLIEEAVRKRISKNINSIDTFSIKWLKTGAQVRKADNICPYCGQEIDTDLQLSLISFYKDLSIEKNDVNEMIMAKINDIYNNIATFDPNTEYIFVENIDLHMLKSEVLDLLNEKKQNIAKKIVFTKISEKTAIKERLRYFKLYLAEINEVINNLEIKDIFNLTTEMMEPNRVINIISRSENLIKNDDLKKDIKTKTSIFYKLNRSIKQKMSDIRDKQEVALTNHIGKINKKLKDYGLKYTIEFKEYKQKSTTRINQAHLELELIPIGFPKKHKSLNKDTIKNVLSEGEKSILAWIFFMVDLENKLTNGKNMIIIDDPISSYDAQRRFTMVSDLRNIMAKSISKEVIIFSHEKSFSNTLAYIPKMKHFNLIDGKLEEIDAREIIESDLKFDLSFIKDNSNSITQEILLEFVIRSRNVLEYNLMVNRFVNGKYFRKTEYGNFFSEASKLIHFRTNKISEEYFKYLEKKFKQITNNSITFDLSNVNLENIDFKEILSSDTSNMYNTRLKIDKFLLDIIDKNSISGLSDFMTTRDLLELAKKHVPENILDNLEMYIPIINTYNHPNQNYGLRRIDCSEIEMSELFYFVNNLPYETITI
ncbi:MAG: AAA family ATPase [Firmicutes bacterium]|nr:AAA family ATPase [Bacillota bacterium]